MGYLPRLNNILPAFPPYTGPHQVGTVDVEVPVTELPLPAESPNPDITTIQFRIFYPIDTPTKSSSQPVRWLPEPQRGYLSAYLRFLGANAYSANLFSYFPNHIYHITIPTVPDAPVRPAPTKNRRWPVMVFSHGLGGTRNSYSHICASVASHGLVVVAPEHRDGSAPISYIRETPMVPDDSKSDQSDQSAKSSSSGAAAKQAVDYLVLPHRHGKDVEDGRNAQLKIRLWELGLMYEALLKMDSDAEGLTSLAQPERLSLFYGMLHLHEPGAVIWSGHSFGAATVIQFVKSIFYGHAVHNELDRSPVEGNQQQQGDQVQLFVPSDSCSLRQQVTPASPVVLLDPWALPLTGQSTRWLLDKPLPSYARTGSGGSNVIVILSEAFFKWRANIDHLKRALSPDPTSPLSSADGRRHARIFYPIGSAHPSQSDFGILFPWLTKKLCKAQEPERTLRLNVRAILQMLRENGVEVANTSRIDMEEPEVAEVAQTEAGAGANEKATDDWKILAPSGDVRGWVSIKLSEEMLEKEALANAGRGEA